MPTRPTTLSSTPVTVSRAAPWRPHRTSNDARESGTSSARLRFQPPPTHTHGGRPRNSRMGQRAGMSSDPQKVLLVGPALGYEARGIGCQAIASGFPNTLRRRFPCASMTRIPFLVIPCAV